MDEEFALCWNNFQDNIQTGFQNLYDRGDLVDVTLAMDGKLLHAHKIVLAICSPYFQEMFNTNPCKHPIIILKDVSFSVMCELLQFMYQGVVNVKHTELSSFMKIAQMLQIKGLATAPTTSSGSQIQKSPDDLTSNSLAINTNNSGHNGNNNNISKASSISGGTRTNLNLENSPTNNNNTETKISSSDQQQQQQNRIPISENSSSSISSVAAGPSLKRLNEFSSESLSVYSRKLTKRTLSELSDNNEHLNQNNDSMDHMNPDDVFLPPIPHISIGESPRFDLNNVKREFLAAGGGSISSGGATEHHHHSHHLSSPSSSSGVHHPTSPGSVRNSLPPPFNFEYNMYAAAAAAANKLDYSNDLHLGSDFTKGGSGTANHMDIPPVAPGERWFHGKLEFMLSQRGKPLLVHDGHTFGIQYIRKDKKYWQCNLSRKFNCKARVTTTDTGEIIVTNNEHCHTEIRQHLRKDYQRNKLLTAINHTLQERLASANNSAALTSNNSIVAHNNNSGSNSSNNNNNCSSSNSKNQSSNNNNSGVDIKSNFINNRFNRATITDDTNPNPNNNSIWQPKTEMIPDISFK